MTGLTSEPRRRGGQPLRADTTDAIVSACLAEIADKGVGRTSIESVARRAGVGKMAVYRRWSTKQEMVVAVAIATNPAADELPDTGSLRGDLTALATETVKWLGDGRVITDLIGETQRDEELSTQLWDAVRKPRRAHVRDLLKRAAARGEAARNVDADTVLDLVMGAVFWRVTVGRGKATPRYLEKLLDYVTAGLNA